MRQFFLNIKGRRKKSTRKLRHFCWKQQWQWGDVSSVQIFDFITSLSSSIFFLRCCTTSNGNNCVSSSLFFFYSCTGDCGMSYVYHHYRWNISSHTSISPFFSHASKQVQQLLNVKIVDSSKEENKFEKWR